LSADDAGTSLGQVPIHGSFTVERDDGAHDVAHLKGSTQLQLNGLAAALDAV
jgi:hypothetical protein